MACPSPSETGHGDAESSHPLPLGVSAMHAEPSPLPRHALPLGRTTLQSEPCEALGQPTPQCPPAPRPKGREGEGGSLLFLSGIAFHVREEGWPYTLSIDLLSLTRANGCPHRVPAICCYNSLCPAGWACGSEHCVMGSRRITNCRKMEPVMHGLSGPEGEIARGLYGTNGPGIPRL